MKKIIAICFAAAACAASMTIGFKAFGYVPPEGSYTVGAVAACPTSALNSAGWEYITTRNGYGMVTNVFYTALNTKVTKTNSTHGVTSSVIALYVNYATGNPSDGTVLVHGNAAKTNVTAVIHR